MSQILKCIIEQGWNKCYENAELGIYYKPVTTIINIPYIDMTINERYMFQLYERHNKKTAIAGFVRYYKGGDNPFFLVITKEAIRRMKN